MVDLLKGIAAAAQDCTAAEQDIICLYGDAVGQSTVRE